MRRAPDLGARVAPYRAHRDASPTAVRYERIAWLAAPLLVLLSYLVPHPIPALRVLGGLGLFLVPWLGRREILRRNGVDLHENGLVVRRWPFPSRAVAFEDVDEVWWSDMKDDHVRGLRLVRHDGSQLDVSVNLPGGNAIANRVESACSMSLVTDAIEALAQGEALHFGKARVDLNEIAMPPWRMEWREIAMVKLEASAIVLVSEPPSTRVRSIPRTAVPHPTLFGRVVLEAYKRVRSTRTLPARTGPEE
ncbi:MAG: DUF6585 family protein [Polyangiaceae bacterium]